MGALIVRPSSSSPSSSSKEVEGKNSKSNNHEQQQKQQQQQQQQDYEYIEYTKRIYDNIYGAATNVPLFGTCDVTSDIHAEISALGITCQNGYNSNGCTAYITIPPCKRCFAALVAFGITRIVTRQESSKLIKDTGERLGIDICNFTKDRNRAQLLRMNCLINNTTNTNLTNDFEKLMKFVEQRRENRKQQRQKDKNKKKKKEKNGSTNESAADITTTTTTTAGDGDGNTGSTEELNDIWK